MTEDSGGATINQSASKPTQEERDQGFAGIAGNAAEKGENPSPPDRASGETPSADGESVAIDVDSARDRAS